MKKYLNVMLAVFGCAVLGFVSLFFGYHYFAEAPEDEGYIVHAETEADTQLAYAPPPAFGQYGAAVHITPDTRMVYETLNLADGTVKVTAEFAPPFLLDADRERLESLFAEWEIVSFSAREVVMRQTLQTTGSRQYIIGVQDGFVSVFYQQPVDGVSLKEMTSTPVSALHEDEQRRLLQGVLVSGEEELIRVLQDYES